MKCFIDDQMARDQGCDQITITCALEITAKKGACDIFVPVKDYMVMVRSSWTHSFLPGGRTKDDMPFFSIAGITFIAITEEEADKYRILK